MTYDIGDQARVQVTFTNLSGVATDPTAVSLQVVSPSRVSTMYYYGSPGQIFRTSAGVFYCDLDMTEHGIWAYRWLGTGAIQAAEEATLFVRRRRT